MYFNFIKREGLMLSPARNRSRAAGGPVPSFGVAPTQPVPSGRFPTTMYEDRTMLSAFSRSLAPARPLRRVLTLTVALALGALPVGASAVVPHPQPAVAAVQPPRNNADTEYNTCVERLVGDASPTPGVWAVCRGYLDEGEYVARRRHDATVTRAELVRLRPGPDMVGFSAFYESNGPTQGVVVLRLAGLPTVPVDLVMRLWGAAAEDIAPNLDHLVELARPDAPPLSAARRGSVTAPSPRH